MNYDRSASRPTVSQDQSSFLRPSQLNQQSLNLFPSFSRKEQLMRGLPQVRDCSQSQSQLSYSQSKLSYSVSGSLQQGLVLREYSMAKREQDYQFDEENIRYFLSEQFPQE